MYREVTSIDLETPREKLLCGFAPCSVFEWRLRKAEKSLKPPRKLCKEAVYGELNRFSGYKHTNKQNPSFFYIIDSFKKIISF